MRLVLASGNARKLAELQALFAPLAIELTSQAALGIHEADEPHGTFVENALAKARQAAQMSGAAALADDSGLCVDALGGAPGVISAHFAGWVSGDGDREARRAVQDAANNRRLLQRLDEAEAEAGAGHGPALRSARFISTLVALRSAQDPEPLIAIGRWEGEILPAPLGEGGFGYDPLMFIPALGKAVAQLDAQAKNALSHRAIASRHMLALMREVWRL